MSVLQRRTPRAATSPAIAGNSRVDKPSGPAAVRTSWYTLWARARDHGWQGPCQPSGPRRCGACSEAPTRRR